MGELSETKINLMLQLVIETSVIALGEKRVKELCDDYGFWKDSKEFRSGEHR